MKQPRAGASLVHVQGWLSLLDHLSDGVCISDENFQLLYLNPAARRLLQLDETPRVGKNVCELVTSALPAPRLGRCQNAACPLQGRQPAEGGVTVQVGSVRVRCLAAPQEVAGRSLHLTLLEDNSAEMELKRQQEDWRNMVAHDLRTPLTPVLATLIMLLDNDAIQGQDRRLIELSIGSARRMLELLSLYLDVAKLDAGLMNLRTAPVSLAAVARRAVESQEALSRQKRQALTMSVPEGLTVCADEELLVRVLQNLVNNAVKYSGERARIELGAEPRGAGARLWVKDDGPGMAAADLPRIFDRFYQAQARRSGATGGTGLGLAFSKQALEAMGARIFVTSEKDVGTEFSIIFPECSGTPQQASPKPQP